MEPQPDQWANKLPDGRIVEYTSNIGKDSGGGPITAQVRGEVIKHEGIVTRPMSRKEIEAEFAGVLAK
jgi:hypothetical protein